jgi:hypothetical protein
MSESAFNPFRTNGTKSSHLAELAVLDRVPQREVGVSVRRRSLRKNLATDGGKGKSGPTRPGTVTGLWYRGLPSHAVYLYLPSGVLG